MLGLAAEAAVQAAGQLASLENGQRALAARLLTWVFMGGVKPQGMVTEELRLVVRNAVLTYVACG